MTLGRQLAGVNDLDGVIEHLSAHDLRIEFARGRFAIMRGQLFGQICGAVKVNPVPAPGPQQEFHQTLEKNNIG